MTDKQFIEALWKNIADIKKYIKYSAPKVVGNLTINHIRKDFAAGGCTDNGFHKWKPTKRQSQNTGAASDYGPLLSGRNMLMNSITYLPTAGKVTVYTNVPYASIHNNGGVIHPKITKKMRRFAWAKHYEQVGKNKNEDSQWKHLALTKKNTLNITIPQRQFMPQKMGKELTQEINKSLETNIKKILNR